VFLGALAAFAVRRARVILATALVLVVGGALLGTGAASRLTPAGLEDPSSQSYQANALVARATHNEALPGLIVLVSLDSSLKKSDSKSVKALIEGLTVALRLHPIEKLIDADPEVGKLQGILDVGGRFLSRNGSLTYLTVQFRAGSEREHVQAARGLAARLSHLRGVRVGGVDLTTWQASTVVNEDARRAELLAFPLLFLLLLWFFRGLVAAALPIVIAASAIALTAGCLRLATQVLSISALVVSVVTALGLGLAIDYCLLIVSRFREELRSAPGDLPGALERTMKTAGRTVLFSGSTVISAFASLLVLPQPFFYSMAIGGALVTLLVCIAALTVLPALLVVLGPRVNALSPRWLQRSADTVARPVLSGRWYRFALIVMRRPIAIAAAAGGLMLALGAPALGMKLTMPSMSTMPVSTSVRQVSDALSSNFKMDPNRTIEVVAAGATRKQLSSYRQTLRALHGVSTITPVQHLNSKTAAIYLATTAAATSGEAQRLVRRIRSLGPPFQTKVTGATAIFVDLKASLASHLIAAALLVALTTCIAIFLLTGSVILPPKTLLMNALTGAATLGILVLVFQDGRLGGLLGSNPGAIEVVQPLFLVAVLFGLSTDYGVFLIDRIRETHEAGASNEQAIALGLERTGRITTTAALLLCVAIGSLVSSRIVAAREISLGISAAVLLDATVVRALLVPALMRLLGEANWWSPKPLRLIYARGRARSGTIVAPDGAERPPDRALV
jgi:RND superfamily putative drug exporter